MMTTNRKDEDAEMSVETVERRRGLSWRGLAQALIGVGALALVIMKSDAHGLADAIKNTRVALLPLAAVASFTVTWLMAYRWGVILGVRGYRFKTRRLFVYYLIGNFFTNFVPGGGVSGDVARLIYVGRDVNDRAFVLSTLIYERLVGMFSLLLIGLAATLVSRGHVQTNPMIYVSEAVLALAFIAIAMMMSEWVSARLVRMVKAMSARLGIEKIGMAAASTITAISELRRHKGLLARTVLISVLVRLVWGMGCYVVSRAMGLPLSLPLVFAFISMADLIRLMPISVGGLGVREWVIIALFAGVGISQERALTFSILAFAPIYLNAITGAVIYISRASLRKSEVGSPKSEVRVLESGV